MGGWLKRRAWVLAIVSVSVVGISLVTSARVWSAVAYQISTDPREPRVGQEVAIRIGTYLPDSASSGGEAEPLPLDDFPWTFVADSPTGDRFVIPLTRSGELTHEWVGTFVFTEVGRWEIGLDPRHLGTPIDPRLGARREILILEANDRASFEVPIILLVSALAILVPTATVGWMLLRRRFVR